MEAIIFHLFIVERSKDQNIDFESQRENNINKVRPGCLTNDGIAHIWSLMKNYIVHKLMMFINSVTKKQFHPTPTNKRNPMFYNIIQTQVYNPSVT